MAAVAMPRGSSSRSSSSDDNDSAAVFRSSAAIDRNSPPTAASTSALSSLQKEVVSGNNGDGNSSSNSSYRPYRGDDATTTIGTFPCAAGRLTFYKDSQIINVFQLADHHQEQSSDNQSTITSPCPWVPEPTEIQQHNNNVKSIGEWPQHQQNKTICPDLVTNSVSVIKSPQPMQQSQPPKARIGEWKQQQYQHRATLTSIGGGVKVASCTATVGLATITNTVRKHSRKCSATTVSENTTDFRSQNWQLQSQSQTLSKRTQPYQHQSFIMIATKAIKEQRHLLSLPSKQHRRFRKRKTAINRESLLPEQPPPSDNLECIVRNLWIRQHIPQLLLRRQLSLNNSVDSIAITAIDTAPVSQHIVTTASSVDSSVPTIGKGKRRSMFYPLSTTTLTIPTTTTTIITNRKGMSGSSKPKKKKKLGQQQPQVLQQQRPVVLDKNVKKTIKHSPSLPLVVSNNDHTDHSITAILSGSAAWAKRTSGSGVSTTVVDTECCIITSTSADVLPQKISHLSSPAPMSLLCTLNKIPSGEFGSSSIVASTNGGFKHPSCDGRKISTVESTTVPLTLPSNIAVATTIYNDPRSTVIVSPSSADTSTVNDATAALTASHQFPTLHHPSSVTTTGQSAAAGYFNVLYQAGMAEAMAYQTQTQLPLQLPKSQSATPMLFSQFSPTGDASNIWKHQVNRRPPILPVTETVGGSGVTMTTSVSTTGAPYSSPLAVFPVNGSGLLPPTTPLPPAILLHHHPVHPILPHHQQQYQPVSKVQKPPSSYHQEKQQQDVNRVSLSSPASLSLLHTLHNSPSGEFGSLPIVASTNSGFKHPSCDSRKRSAMESTTVPQILPSNIAVATTTYNDPRSTEIVSPSSAVTSSVNYDTAALSAPHQFPTFHYPSWMDYVLYQAGMPEAMAYQTQTQLPLQLPKSQSATPMLFSQFSPTGDASNIWKHQVNRRPPILPVTETVGGSGVTMTTSVSTTGAPYSSPLAVFPVNGSGLLPPTTPLPPAILLHHHPVHPILPHHQQQYQPVSKVQKPPSLYQQHKRQQGISVKQRTVVTTMGSAQYGYRMDGKNMGVVDVESTSSTDCVPLNISKDSVAENVINTSTTSNQRDI